MRVLGELRRLAALRVREEAEAVYVDALQEDGARRGPALGVGRRERHRLRQLQAGRARRLEPAGELRERVGQELDGVHQSSSSTSTAPPVTRSPSATCTRLTTASY